MVEDRWLPMSTHTGTALLIAIALSLSGCAGTTTSIGNGSSGVPPEVDNSPERYLLLQGALEKLNQLVDLVNEADSAVDAISESASDRGDPEQFFAQFDEAGAAWERVLTHLEMFTEAEEAELPTLRNAMDELATASAHWQLWAVSYHGFLIRSLREGVVDEREGRRLDRGYREASRREKAGMAFVSEAQDTAIFELCRIDDYGDFVSGEDSEVDC
jgi:hypothetical protein